VEQACLPLRLRVHRDHCYIHITQLIFYHLPILGDRLNTAKVTLYTLRIYWDFQLNLLETLSHLLCITVENADIESLSRHLLTNFQARAIRASCHDTPGTNVLQVGGGTRRRRVPLLHVRVALAEANQEVCKLEELFR